MILAATEAVVGYLPYAILALVLKWIMDFVFKFQEMKTTQNGSRPDKMSEIVANQAVISRLHKESIQIIRSIKKDTAWTVQVHDHPDPEHPGSYVWWSGVYSKQMLERIDKLVAHQTKLYDQVSELVKLMKNGNGNNNK